MFSNKATVKSAAMEQKAPLPPPREDSIQARSAGTSASSSAVPADAAAGGAGMMLIRIGEAQNLAIPAQLLGLLPTDEIHQRSQPYCVLELDKNEVVANAKEWFLGKRTANWNHRTNFDVSRACDINVNIYVHTDIEDILVGSVKIRPELIDSKVQDTWYQLQSNEGSEAGQLHLQIVFKKSQKNQHLSIDAFDLLKVIGKGSFGKVMQVRKKDTNRVYAMKILKKAHIVERSEVSHTLAERAVLAQINHPFIVPLKFSFQSPDKLYLVLAFINGGELFHHLQKEGRFTEERGKFYAAELLCALECLHTYNIIYRDLKPENILLDYTGHIALCDFGLCKLNMKEKDKTNTFCGTPEYLAPELLLGQGYSKVVDWWTLGILVYEMLTGLPPFYDENTNEMYKRILTEELKLPDYISPTARDLLKGLLNRDPLKRLGAGGAEDIRKHAFFADVNWQKLLGKKYTPPFKPNVASAVDTSNFDEEFTSEMPVDSVVEHSTLSESVQQQFQGFTYQGPDHIGSVGGSLLASGKLSYAANAGAVKRS